MSFYSREGMEVILVIAQQAALGNVHNPCAGCAYVKFCKVRRLSGVNSGPHAAVIQG